MRTWQHGARLKSANEIRRTEMQCFHWLLRVYIFFFLCNTLTLVINNLHLFTS